MPSTGRKLIPMFTSSEQHNAWALRAAELIAERAESNRRMIDNACILAELWGLDDSHTECATANILSNRYTDKTAIYHAIADQFGLRRAEEFKASLEA